MNFNNSCGDKSTQKAHSSRQIRDEPKLPPELTDDILDFLGAQDSNESRTTLAQCLLVSRSFYLRARGIFFAKIKTSERLFPSSGRKETEMIDVLLEIMEEDLLRNVDPLVMYVRDLRVSMFPLFTIDAASEWNAQRANLPLLLTMLPNLQSFGLEFTTPMDWNAIYEPMYIGITCTLKSSNLTALYLANIYHFSTSLVLGQCINLRDLHLENITTHRPRGGFAVWQDMFPSMDKYQTPWDPKSLQNLENVETKSSGDVFRRIMTVKRHTPQAAPFSHLKSFTVHVSNEDLAKEWQALECAAVSLECLTLHGIIASESNSILSPALILSRFTSLHTLILTSNIAIYQYRLSPVGLGAVLKSLATDEPTTLENLVIDFHAMPYITLHAERLFLCTDESWAWSKVDLALARQTFASLKKVRFNFLWRYHGDKFPEPLYSNHQEDGGLPGCRKGPKKERAEILARLHARVKAVLPMLDSRQILECSYTESRAGVGF